MNIKDLELHLAQQLQENHKLLQENNLLLRKIIKQNQLICEITQKNIRHFSKYFLWYENDEVIKLKKELEDLSQQDTSRQ